MWKVFSLILLISLVLVGVWFQDGYVLGASEDGLIFYNLSHYFHQSQYSWMEYPGLGSPSMMIIAAKPTYFLLSILQNFGIPGFLLQVAVFWFLIVSAGIGMYLLVRQFFPNLAQKYIFLSILFYWFNPISLAYLLNRSLLNYLFFFALLPIASYLYIKGLKNRGYLWLFILNIVLLLYSYAFSYVAFVILFWLWLILMTFYFIVIYKKRIFPMKYFSLNLLLFSLLSSWWILPVIALNVLGGADPTSNLFKSQTNVDTLTALSKSTGDLNNIFKLINASVNSSDALSWVKLYYSPILSATLYFFAGVILFFIIKFRKNSEVLLLGSLFLTIIFLAKGSNPPFGKIYSFLFQNILILQIFRNPFEKFSFLLSLISSVLLGPSIYEITNKLNSYFKIFLYPTVLAVLVLYLGFPLYSGLALTNKFPPTNDYSIGYKVAVPIYYQEAYEWLKDKGENFRYLGLPLSPEGVTYKWEKGYTGLELPVALFDSKAILLNTSVPFFNQIIPQIEKVFLSEKEFFPLANLLNAKYYLLRNDIDYSSRGMTNPKLLEDKLTAREKEGELKKAVSFGSVSIWENLKWRDNTFYLAKKISTDQSLDDFEELIEDTESFISYQKINPTKYKVHLENISKPTTLVFAELYNNGWKASYKDKAVLTGHIRANIYANAWNVNRMGTFDIIIEFTPQRWMETGEKISIIGTISAISLLGFLSFKLKRT